MKEPLRCTMCDRKLEPDSAVWLEMDCYTNHFHDPESDPVPLDRTQGCYPFGAACAQKMLGTKDTPTKETTT